MTALPQISNAGRKARFWLTIGIIGLVAISAGTILPQMLPAVADVPRVEQSNSSPASPKKNDLSYSPPEWPEAPDPKAMILRLVLGTAIVLGLCVGTLWLSKRWLCKLPSKSSATGPLTLVDSLPLGNRSQIHLIGVGHLRILVGVDASGLKSVVALTEPFEETLIRAQTDSVSAMSDVEKT